MNENLLSRRLFLKNSSLSGLALASGVALGESSSDSILREKRQSGLSLMNDRPLNMETPMHLLDDEVTPVGRMFVRNNGLIPEVAFGRGLDKWRLQIDGEVDRSLSLSLADLKTKFKRVSLHMVLECGGNGRKGYYPPAKGNQWTYGAIGCPVWGGVRLADVLKSAGVQKSAVYLGYYGSDQHLSGDRDKVVISRGFPIEKALDPMTMLAFEMNGQPLPPEHGFPVRIVCPGFPGSASGKWIKRLWIRSQVHDGPKMEAPSYQVPSYPVAPGQKVPSSDFSIIESMPVKSLITFPRSGTGLKLGLGKRVSVRGWAWTSAEKITAVDVTADFGQTWVAAELKPARNRYGWQRWQVSLPISAAGYYEIWARATDATGAMQPMVVPGWNPKGYLNNAMPRIALNISS